MARYVVASATFDAAHRDLAEGPHLHGHTFAVSVKELGTEAGGICRTLQGDLQSVVRELDHHDLGEMLIGGSPSLDGIGFWVIERLLVSHALITEVEVSDGTVAAVVTREIR